MKKSSISLIIAWLMAGYAIAPSLQAQALPSEDPPLVGGFFEELFSGFAEKLIDNTIGITLTTIHDNTQDNATGTLLLLLEGSTGMALDKLNEKIEETLTAVNDVQASLNAFETRVAGAFQQIAKEIDQNTYNASVKPLNDAYTTLGKLSQDYAAVTNRCYENGVVKTNLDYQDQLVISQFITDVAKADLPTLLGNLATAANPLLGQGIYDVTLAHAKLNAPFVHQTYPAMYQTYNYMASLRSAACYYYKEYQCYRWNAQTDEQKQQVGLQDWLNIYFQSQISNSIYQINLEATNSLSNLAALLAGANPTNLNTLDYLENTINQTNVFIDARQNQTSSAVYQLVSNQDGKGYLLMKQAQKLPLYTTTDNADNILNYYYLVGYQTRSLDGRYQMAEDIERIAGGLFPVPVPDNDLLSYLRDEGKLTEINPNTLGVMLSDTTAASYFDMDQYMVWNWEELHLLDIQKCDLQDVTGKQYLMNKKALVTTEDISEGSTYEFSGYPSAVKLNNATFLSIYYDTHLGAGAANPTNYFKPSDRTHIPSLFSLIDGDILDLTAFKGSISSTIRICGDATIIGGGADKALSGLVIETYGGDLTVSNLFLTTTSKSAITNIHNSLTIKVTGDNQLLGDSAQGVVSSSSSSAVVFTGPGSLVVSNSSTGPAVKATGNITATNAANLAFYSQGATSISSGKYLSIVNSTAKSHVGKESNHEFSCADVVSLDNSTLNMTYGITNQVYPVNLVWAGKVRYTATVTTYLGGIAHNNTGTEDSIDMTITDKHGTSASTANIGQSFNSKFTPGSVKTFYFSAKPLAGVLDHISFSNNGTDAWYPDNITVSSLSLGNSTHMQLYKWVGSNQTTTFYDDALCVDMDVGTGNVDDAGSASQIYVSLVHDGGKQGDEVRIDNLAAAFDKNTYTSLRVTLGRASEVINPEGFMIRSDASGNKPGWFCDSLSTSPVPAPGAPHQYLYLFFWPNLWVIDTANKFLGTTDTNTGVFEVTVKTADVSKAGTDAKIYLKIYGSTGTTDFQNIKDIPTYDAFEQGYKDTFRVAYSAGIGIPQKIELYTDNGGSGPAWNCEYVDIAAVGFTANLGSKYHFEVNHEFSSSKDHQVVGNPQVSDAVEPGPPARNPLVVTIAGEGTVSPDCAGTSLRVNGETYTLTAVPDTGYSFTGWTGGIATNTATLTFVMKPGLALEANFGPASATFNGLFSPSAGVTHQNSGCINLTTTAKRKYSGRLQIGGGTYSISGQLDAAGNAVNLIKRSNQSPLTVRLLVSDEDWMGGTVSNASWVAEIVADRGVYSSKTRFAPEAGQYTLIVPGTNGDTTLPQGSGYGTVSVSKSGIISFAGSLADGTKVSQSVPISQQGQWPLYAGLYRGQGSVLGWIAFKEAAKLAGGLVWTKPLTLNEPYPSAFAWMTEALGARYTPPGKGSNVLASVGCNLTLSIWGGGLTDDIFNAFTLNAKNQVKDASGEGKLSLSFTPATGLFSGTQIIPEAGKAISFKGVVLQDQGVGAGYFMGTEQGGSIRLEPTAEPR